MPSCCRCNGSGKCLNCARVKKGIHCTDCLPHRRGRCPNRAAGPAGPGVASSNSSNPPRSSPPRAPAPSTPQSNTTSLPSPSVRGQDGFHHPPPSELPDFAPIATGVFTWGEHDSSAFSSSVKAAYSEIVHWKRNIFAVPSGALGKRFVNELARLFRAYADASALEGVALCAAMVVPALLLQCPHRSSKTRVNKACLERRLRLWEEGDIHSLLHEGRCIQQRLPRRQLTFHYSHLEDKSKLTRHFTNLMQAGKTKDAVHLLSDQKKDGVLHLNEVVDVSHPEGKTVHDHTYGSRCI